MIKNKKKYLLYLCISTILFSTQTIANEYQEQYDQSKSTRVEVFPDTLENLINAVGKKDFITIPIPIKYYNYHFKNVLTDSFVSNKSELQEIFKKAKITELKEMNVVLINFDTKVKNSLIEVKDEKNDFIYKYNISNGYVLSTQLLIPIKKDKNESHEEYIKKLNFLKDSLDRYLTKKGFEKKKNLFNSNNDLMYKSIEYSLDNKDIKIERTVSDLESYVNRIELTISDKNIKNEKDIEEEIKNMDSFKGLDEILK